MSRNCWRKRSRLPDRSVSEFATGLARVQARTADHHLAAWLTRRSSNCSTHAHRLVGPPPAGGQLRVQGANPAGAVRPPRRDAAAAGDGSLRHIATLARAAGARLPPAGPPRRPREPANGNSARSWPADRRNSSNGSIWSDVTVSTSSRSMADSQSVGHFAQAHRPANRELPFERVQGPQHLRALRLSGRGPLAQRTTSCWQQLSGLFLEDGNRSGR